MPLDAKKGQKIHNSRTGDTGEFIEFTQRWTGRHEVTKAVVLVDGDQKVWALSSCKIVEELAPRVLVYCRKVLLDVLNNLDSLKQCIDKQYSTDTKQRSIAALHASVDKTNIIYIINNLESVNKFTDLGSSHISRIIMILRLANRCPYVMYQTLNMREFGSIVQELLDVYLGRNPE